MNPPAPAAPVVVFDGECNLCHGVVSFVMAHETLPVIRFATTASEMGMRLCAASGIPNAGLETFLFVIDGQYFDRSDAAFMLCKQLKAPWRWAAVFRVLPRPLRDSFYNWIANTRYRWLGKRDYCAVLDAAQASRFYE